ncbi:GFA family protein [Endozoicomonadaceae bacterium StTr2]
MKGQCRCGQVTYETSRDPVFSGYCHCHACQKRSSAPCTGFVMVPWEGSTLSGETRTYHDLGGSGQPVVEHSCINCGSLVLMELKVLDNIVAIMASTLEQSDDFIPESHVWLSSQNKRFEIQDDLLKQQGPPKQMAPYLARKPV